MDGNITNDDAWYRSRTPSDGRSSYMIHIYDIYDKYIYHSIAYIYISPDCIHIVYTIDVLLCLCIIYRSIIPSYMCHDIHDIHMYHKYIINNEIYT